MRRVGLDLVEAGQERVHLWEGRRHQHPDLLAFGAQRLREGQAAAERVAVGVLVAEDQDLLVGVDEILDLVEQVRLVALGGDYGCSSRGRTSLSSSEMWTLYSIDGSSSKRRSGENLRF